ncbi:Pesticin receptor precursor [Komagataeibacter saccharivorans]|uniref:Pesticin receptor n=4 Tax=Acetobacteraceae TaxID=433 RepID=A0A347WC78_9PROT|nr:TonB-dependent receptor [Komagataeibacter saccharivorans]AXY22471.1 Pesticin receptor precursor [Komagataeibacter saccharivorans]
MFAVQHMRHKSVMGHAFRSFLMLSVYTGGLPAGVALAATVTDEKQRRTPVVAHHAASTPQAHDHHAAPEVISVTRTRRPFSADQHRAGNTTNLTAEELVTHHVTTVEDIQNLVPNLTIQTEGGSNVPDYYLRGIGMQDYTQNNMSSVMTYFDGVPYTITAMSSGQMFDVASVGVDPGPVGFEHGIADTGGEVRITTNDPTKTLHYGVSEDIASYARSKTNFYVSGPITKRLQFRIAGQMLEGGAFRYNRVNGESLGRANEGALRAKLAWQPDDKTNIKLTGNWSQDSSEADAGFILGDNSNILPRDRDIYATGWSLNPQYAKILGISPNSKPSYNDMQWGINLDMERDLGWAKLTTISSFQQQQRHEYIDRDAEAYRSGDSYLTGSTNVFSQEIRLSGRVLDDRLQWVTGMYYNRVRASGENWFDYTDRSGKYYFQNSAHVQPQQDFAQFVNLTYSLTHKLRLTFGLEHQTDDRQFLDDAVYRYNPVTLARTYSQVFGNHGTLTNQFSGKVGINYQVQPNVMLYADIRRGVKPGGFTANTTLTEQQAAGFKPEWLMAYEVGFKSEFFNHRLRINGAAFWDSYHDQQYFSYILVPNWGTVGSYVNVPRSHIFGTELSISAHPVRGLTLSQNVGYQRGTYDDFQVLNVQAVSAYYARTGTWKSFTDSYNGADMGIPKLTLNGTVSYETRPVFGKYTVTMEGDYSYRGAQDTVPRGTGAYLLPSYFLMNGSVTFKPVRGPWSVTAYATNILNRDYIVSRTLATTVNMGISGQPRFVGGRFAYNF